MSKWCWSTDKMIFLNTTAKWDDRARVVFIDTRKIARNYEERDKLPKRWWAVVSAAFIFNSLQGKCVALVQRTLDAKDNPGKWALIPAGGSENIIELRKPGLALEREAWEELKLYWTRARGKCVDPLSVSDNKTSNPFKIKDKANGKEYTEKGEIYKDKEGKQLFLMRTYLVKKPLETLMIFDGEMKDRHYLDRWIALVPLDKLDGIVKPFAIFKSKIKMKNTEIDLSGYQTPTLDWFRKYIKNNIDKIAS